MPKRQQIGVAAGQAIAFLLCAAAGLAAFVQLPQRKIAQQVWLAAAAPVAEPPFSASLILRSISRLTTSPWITSPLTFSW